MHFHARQPDDPSEFAHSIDRYREINDLIRSKAPMLVDNSQGVLDLPSEGSGLLGTAHFVVPQAEAEPDIMALNPGPMTFRGGAAVTGGGDSPSKVFISTFDDAEQAANRLRDNGVKPQVFIYHPGHLDVPAVMGHDFRQSIASSVRWSMPELCWCPRHQGALPPQNHENYRLGTPQWWDQILRLR